MKRIVITESERKNILRSHGVILEEKTPDQMLASIQTAIGTYADKKIGHDTTSKLVKTLQGIPTTTTTQFDFSCAKNNKNMVRKTEYDDNENSVFKGYQIGDFVFDKLGNYYKVSDESKKGTYTCNGTEIKLNDGTMITGEVKKDNSGLIKQFIDDFEEEETSKSEIARRLLKRYTKEEIIKANSSYEPVINNLSEIPNKQNVNRNKVNQDKKIQDTEDEVVSDEDNLFNIPDK